MGYQEFLRTQLIGLQALVASHVDLVTAAAKAGDALECEWWMGELHDTLPNVRTALQGLYEEAEGQLESEIEAFNDSLDLLGRPAEECEAA